jgi:hypothetical protein
MDLELTVKLTEIVEKTTTVTFKVEDTDETNLHQLQFKGAIWSDLNDETKDWLKEELIDAAPDTYKNQCFQISDLGDVILTCTKTSSTFEPATNTGDRTITIAGSSKTRRDSVSVTELI